jgi:hypothetical protein
MIKKNFLFQKSMQQAGCKAGIGFQEDGAAGSIGPR